jgi:asparagine synthase (glutamine-hydrolysing)
MCGICGKLFFDKNKLVSPELLLSMTRIMDYRGPDDEGLYNSGCIGLGHRRLSIIDLSSGKQPICNEDEKVWIVFNGEIYNYLELRSELIAKGHVFRTRADTEVIVHAYEEYKENCVSKLRGMFAFAIWDERERLLFLARDRVGIKPLYYCLTNKSLIFASEIKAILQDPEVKRETDHQMIDRFLTYFYVPGNETLIKRIYKLEPGHYLIFRNEKIRVKQYWEINFSSINSNYNFAEAKADLHNLLKDTVRLHMISDVPVGFLLSGGVDSTAMLSLSPGETDKDISTFTIGFDGENFADERPYARLAAERFGTKHYEMTIKAQDFVDFLPKYVWHMEEPVCEPPAVALYYITKLAKDYVKVLISGEGGDEGFAGYQNYRNLVWLERLKGVAGPFNGPISALFDNTLNHFGLFKRFRKYSPLLTLPLEEYYYSRTSTPFSFFNKEFEKLYSPEFGNRIDKSYSIQTTRKIFENLKSKDNLSRMLYIDTKTWLPDDLLIKADKMTMANSVELRVPLLDHKVLEFAAGLPSTYKLRGLTTKFILKSAFRNIIPLRIIKRKKTGFPVPYETWMRKDLRTVVQDTLLSQRAIERGYFNRRWIEKILSANLNGGDYAKEVFSLLTLELWQREFIDNQLHKS